MKARDTRALQSLCAVQRFLQDNAARLDGPITIHRSKLDQLVGQVTSLASRHDALGVEGKELTHRRVVLRDAVLREHMVPIARIASADLPTQRRVKALRIPIGYLSADRMAAHAQVMA